MKILGKEGIPLANNSGYMDEDYHTEASYVPSEYNNYSQFLSDHYICEIYLGSTADASFGLKNWREFSSRLMRTENKSVRNDVFLIQEEPLALSVNNDYKTIGDTGIFRMLKAGAAIKNFSAKGQLALNLFAKGAQGAGALDGPGIQSDIMITPSRFLEAQFYEKTSSMPLPLTFKFKWGQYGLWDAFEEVFKPALAFLIMASPSILGARLETPGPTDLGLIASLGKGLLSAGKTVDVAKEGFGLDQLWQQLTVAEESGTFAKHITVILGQTSSENKALVNNKGNDKLGGNSQTPFNDKFNIRNLFSFRPCVLKSCSVVFSKEKDVRGFPIGATVKLNIETQFPVVSSNFGEVNVAASRKKAIEDADALAAQQRQLENEAKTKEVKEEIKAKTGTDIDLPEHMVDPANYEASSAKAKENFRKSLGGK